MLSRREELQPSQQRSILPDLQRDRALQVL